MTNIFTKQVIQKYTKEEGRRTTEKEDPKINLNTIW